MLKKILILITILIYLYLFYLFYYNKTNIRYQKLENYKNYLFIDNNNHLVGILKNNFNIKKSKRVRFNI